MTTNPPLFVELCAGTAALSLRLQARHARPPVSRMGAKTGYADAILAIMGLRPGQRAGHYLWCEPDPGCRLLLEAYRDRKLAQAAADIIRGWKDAEPRALWERLRAEGPVREDGGARELARTIQILASNELINLDTTTWRNTGAGGSTFGGSVGYGADRSPRKLDGLPLCSATIAPDARTVDPREVARWATIQGWAVAREPNRLWEPGQMLDLAKCGIGTTDNKGRHWGVSEQAWIGGRLDALPTCPATILPDARTVEPLPPLPPLPPGTIAYIDPPYVGTTGYATDLPRSEVVRLARLWHEAGARVYISEAEPLAELDGWHRVEITAERKGQKRTFSKQQAEWLTCSHQPAWTPAVQGDLIQWAAK